jgi:outer membrane protein assembly factor BamB
MWPGVVLVILQLLVVFVAPAIAPDAELFGLPLGVIAIFAAVVTGAAILLWWLFFSRAPWAERLAVVVLMVVAVAVTRLLVDESIAGAHMGVSVYIFPIPLIALALVVWAGTTQRVRARVRHTALIVALVLACLPMTLIRTAGVMGAGSEYHWRWTPTPEERLLAQTRDEPLPTVTETSSPAVAAPVQPEAAAPAKAPAAVATPSAPPTPIKEAAPLAGSGNVTAAKRNVRPADWPGFRGPNRDSVVHGAFIETDWATAPPTELWRRAVGPGWSSFAVDGDLLYTQEQRGEEEIVGCYRVSTGEPVWRHSDRVRFWESNGGAGPRGTPTLYDGRVYAFGATGILNALDARTGKSLWSRNVATDTKRAVPDWGFASSPLIVDDVVIVAAAGTLAAYDMLSGEPRWQGPRYGGSYSSPHLVSSDGVDQVVLLGGPGAISVSPRDGKLLWEHKWVPGAIVQPAVIEGGDVLVNAIVATGGQGTRRLHLSRASGAWTVEERWTSNGLKPYFNDFVVHDGHAYGFDGSILAAIDLKDGTRRWKGGRYGNGQLVLLPDQDLLLVISEDGELALVKATPDQFTEVARLQALNGKTWNHPVVVRDVLLVRNGEEMAAYRLTRTTR